nr:Ig-like domain-containing protein [Tenuifilaceae bacterium]
VETFRYYVEDADGDYSLATVTVTVIEKPNYVPIANDDYRGCSFNSSVTVDVLSNDTGIDDVPLTLSININPTDGNAQVNPDNTITFTPFDGFIGLTTFGYRVTDANGDSDEAMVFINVKAGINAVPLARDDNAHTFINKSVEINVLANDEGLDDGFGALTIRQQPAFGTVVVNANRTLTYFPGYMFVGSDSFSYMVEDVDGDYSVAIVTVVVDEKPDSKPVANDDSRGCSFNSAVTVDVLINDSGLDDVPLVVSVTEAPQSGSAVPNPDNTITFTPEANFTGTITFRYTVTDVDGDFDDAQVTIHVKAGQNIVPYAVPDNATTLVNKPAVVNVLANDTGLDDGFGSLTVFEQPKFGSVVVNSNRTVTYTPSYMFIGVETFRYMVTDVDGDYAIGTVTITVIEKPNSIPVANDDLRGCSFETPVVVDVLVNDTGLEDVPLTLTISELPTIGSTVVNPNNTITFTPPAAFTGIATFRYTVTDSDGDSDDALVTIRVKEGENYVPHSNDDAASTIINTNVDINVLANDTGLDDGFERLIIFEMPSFGTVTVNENRTVTYTPSYMFLGTDTFRYWVEDVDGDYSIATVTVEVTERPNYLPVANDDYRATSLNTPRIVDVLVNDTGLDDTPVEVSITNQASHGTTVVEADNTVTYTPQNSYLGADHFSYRVTDRDGDWDEATVFIDVKPVNMIPVAVDDYVQTYVNQPVDIHVLENDSLLYEGIKSLQVFSAPKWGTVQVNDNHTITYTPSYFFIGNDEFKYLVEDVDGDYDIATVYVVVLATQNAIPVANDDHRATSKNTPLDINVLINDDGLDDGWIRVFIDEFPDAATGTAAVKPDNMVSFIPATDYLGLSTLKYFIVDRNNDTSNVATVTVNVKEVNFIPVANADTASTNMNVPLLVDVVNNDTGLDDGLDYIKVMGKPLHGFAYAFDNHNIKYFPSSWFVGTDSLTYLVADEDGDYDIGKLYITVNERPDHKPLANPDGRGTTTNTPVTVDVLFNDTGLEDGGIKVLLNIFPINGNVLLHADNTVTYTPNTGFLGEDVFYYQVCDFDSDCSSAAVTINVKNANLVPIAYNDTVTTFKNKAISINVLFNDRNLNDGGIRTVVFSNPTNGAVSVNPDNSILYTPANNFFGVDSLWYYVADVDGDYSLAKVVIDVLNRENFTPQANDDDVEIFMDTETTIDVLTNDTGLNDGVKALAVETSPTNGICRITSDFKVYYSPLTGFVGTETFTYRVTDRDDESSVAYITVRVVPDPDGKVVVPEAFSPNGDGFNDTFEVLNIGQFQHITLKVYNRWGNLVYKSDRYKNDWDGTANVSLSLGSKLPAGTYYYLLEILDTGKTYKGSVFIKR